MKTLNPNHDRPVRRCVCATKAPHGVKPSLIVAIYPDGYIGLREMHRPARTEKRLAVGELYALAINAAVLRMGRRVRDYRREGLSLAQARRKARKECGL